MDQHTFVSSFLISIVLIRVAFFIVSSWILSIDSDWFSRLPIVFTIRWNIVHGSCLPSTCNLEIILSDCNHHTCFQSNSVLDDTSLALWLFCPSVTKYIYIYIYMHLLLGTSLRSILFECVVSQRFFDNIMKYCVRITSVEYVRFGNNIF